MAQPNLPHGSELFILLILSDNIIVHTITHFERHAQAPCKYDPNYRQNKMAWNLSSVKPSIGKENQLINLGSIFRLHSE